MSQQSGHCENFATEEDDPLYLLRRSLKMLDIVIDGCQFESRMTHSFVILGASGNLATKKIYPALWWLFRDCLLPSKSFIYGFARTHSTVEQIRERCQSYMKVNSVDEERYEKYWTINYYMTGSYDSEDDFRSLNHSLIENELGEPANRIFHIALPPHMVEQVIVNIKNNCMPPNGGWIRIVVEKPFGRDLHSSDKISQYITSLFTEAQIFRIDHEIGNEVFQNVTALRFSNNFLSATWNRHHIASVLISYKEDVGVYGRGGHFDHYGIIRDVMQTHLMQIVALIAMEKPATCHPEDMRDEKVRLLKRIQPLRLRDIIIGQYVGNRKGQGEERFGYLDDITVPKSSITPTYAITILRIKNERWDGVPFILRCGKALDEQRTEVRLQYYTIPGDIFDNHKNNEFIFNIKPNPSVYMKVVMKSPGLGFLVEDAVIDMSLSKQHSKSQTLDSYERLMLDIVCGTHMHFIRSDELHETWRIFTPILRQIEEDRIRPLPYIYGSQGPKEAEVLLKENFFWK